MVTDGILTRGLTLNSAGPAVHCDYEVYCKFNYYYYKMCEKILALQTQKMSRYSHDVACNLLAPIPTNKGTILE